MIVQRKGWTGQGKASPRWPYYRLRVEKNKIEELAKDY